MFGLSMHSAHAQLVKFMLRSSEVVAMLRVLSILHIAICVPTRWLAGKTHVVCAMAFLKEFRDTTKATHNYLLSIDGRYSLKKISNDMRKAGLGKEASSSTSESDFASAKQAVKDYGTLRLDSAAAAGQTRTNDDFGRCHDLLINILKKDGMNAKRGTLFDLPNELIQSLVYAARKGVPRLRKRHDNALKILNEAKLDKLKTAQLENAEKAVEENIVAMNYYEIGVSERRWKSPREATTIYNQLGSETARLKAVKEQILIHRLGFGWVDCAHQWSCKGHGTYSSRELLNFLKDTVLPIERERGIPSEPATNYAISVSINYELGTISDLQFVDESINTKSSDDLAKDAIEERERSEQEYETDRQSRLQPNIMPKVDESLVGFNIEYCFEYVSDDDDSTYLAWCDGVVHSIVNENSRMVMIKWNEKKLREGDAEISRHKLGIRGWNPKKTQTGGLEEVCR